MIVWTDKGLRYLAVPELPARLGQSGCTEMSIEVRPPGQDPNRPSRATFNPCLDDPETVWCALTNFLSDDGLARCIGDNLVQNYRAKLDNLIDWQRRNIASWSDAWGLFRAVTQSARDWLFLRKERLERGNILIPGGPDLVGFYQYTLTRVRDEQKARFLSLWLKPYPGEVPPLPDFGVRGDGQPPLPPPTGEKKEGLWDRFVNWISSQFSIGKTASFAVGVLSGALALWVILRLLSDSGGTPRRR